MKLVPFLALSLLSTASAQDLSAQVSYRTPAAPASKAIAELAKQTNIDLRIAAPLDKEPLILRLKDVPLKDAMDRIAHTLRGTWQQKDKTFTLQRTPAQQAEMLSTAEKIRTNFFRELVDRRMAGRPTGPFTPEVMKQMLSRPSNQHGNTIVPQDGSMLSDPGDARLVDQVLLSIDPNVVGSRPFSQRLVFSSNPRPLQFPLNLSQPEVDAILQEQNEWMATGKALGRDHFNDHPIDKADARIVAVVQLDPQGTGSITTVVVDSQERAYKHVYDDIILGTLDDDEEEPKELGRFKQYGLKPIKLSPLAKEMRSLARASSDDGASAVRPPSKALREVLLHPEANDPLALVASEILLRTADLKGWNLAAILDDTISLYAGTEDPSAADPTMFLASAAGGHEIDVADGWLTARPTNAIKVEARRVDRPALRAYVADVDRLGYSGLESEAAFAAANGPHTEWSTASVWASLLCPSSDPFSETDWQLLRLYGLLDVDQRHRLKSGGIVSVSELRGEQREAVAEISQNPPFPDFESDFASPSLLTEPGGGVWMLWNDEPTESIAALVPDDGELSIKTKIGPGIKARGQSDEGAWETWVEPQYAARLIRRYAGSNTLTFASATKQTYQFQIALSPKARFQTSLSEYRANLSPWARWTSLPLEARKAIQQGMSELDQLDFPETAPSKKETDNSPPTSS